MNRRTHAVRGGGAMHQRDAPIDEAPPCQDGSVDERALRQALHVHRWLLDAMLQQFPLGSVNVFDRELRYLFAAGTGLERVGLSPASLIGKRLEDLFPADAV